ncbi:MAG: hypothetical protein OXG88_07170 [Gammaproteobacteria bacterium]|nr:hypothetical protein [Gammaproteobacteria bacterium]
MENIEEIYAAPKPDLTAEEDNPQCHELNKLAMWFLGLRAATLPCIFLVLTKFWFSS